jgi:hypothetical protein
MHFWQQQPPTVTPLLFSGGKCPDEASIRFWNDLEFMYLTLRGKCGFAEDNIVVVYKDGAQAYPTSPMQVGYPANAVNLSNAISHLNSRMNLTSEDTLFVFVTNHGGGNYFPPGTTSFSSGGANKGRLVDSNTDESLDTGVKYDEVIYFYSDYCDALRLTRDEKWKESWDNLLNAQKPVRINVYEQCFSGGFLWDMKHPSSAVPAVSPINIAAASEYGYSFANPPYNYDNFSYHFTAALNGQYADGTALRYSPDIDPMNNKVSPLGGLFIWKGQRFGCLS